MFKSLSAHIKSHKKWYGIGIIVVILIVGSIAYGRIPHFEDITSELRGEITLDGEPKAVIQILSPKPGEEYETGDTITFQWEVVGPQLIKTDQPPKSTIHLMHLEKRPKVGFSAEDLLKARPIYDVIAKNVEGNSYEWIIPDGFRGSYWVGIIDSLNQKGLMGGFFTIKKVQL